ncbi:MAG: hypothetical protein WAO56_12720 [Miniphocaeibacter sp.]|uniref:hypothetical protein n=1 Tax=Miniphocaeibacter sp. TaxID=3100973 RepID=UPI0017DBED10|nr:hypothetical protein [Gallicola sp.]
MKKKLTLIVCLVLCIFVFTACEEKFEKGVEAFVSKAIEKADEAHKRDYNDNRKIAKRGTTHSGANIRINIENNNIEGKFDFFGGRYEICEIRSLDKNTLKLNTEIHMDNEDFKIVLIDSRENLTEIAEGNSEKELELQLDKDDYILKMVSKGSSGNFKIDMEDNKNIEITRIHDED